MRILLSVFLFTFCTTVLGQTTEPTTTADTTLTDTTPTITSDATTTVPPTTVAPTTQSSTASSSTSTTPASSTPSSTTASSTTIVTSSSSTTEITSTASPVPSTKAPKHDACSFNITQRDVTCIRAEMNIDFIIDIQGTKHTITLGCNATTTGSDCSSNETQALVLFEPNFYNLTMIFEKEDKHVFVRNVSFSYILPEGRDEVVNNTENLFAVSAGNSYLCKSTVDVHLGNVTMEVSEVHIQAFLEKDNNDFGAVKECELDEKVSDIVPIAVGVALGALIIIVLIAYLVGRRRSRQRGYQSV